MSSLHIAANFARLLGDPIRLMILRALVRKDASASELLAVTGATQSNLSNHLKLLRDNKMVEDQRHGRQIFYKISTPAIAELVEALFMAAPDEKNAKPPPAGPLATARTCYDHLAGKLGVRLLEGLVAARAIRPPEKAWTDLQLGPEAAKIFSRLGIDLQRALKEGTRRRLAYCCPDWSESGHSHIGGLIGAVLCDRCLNTGWITRDKNTRAISFTKSGSSELAWLILELCDLET